MTLASLMAAHTGSVFLNADHHAESWTFRPQGGESRAITAVAIERTERAEERIEEFGDRENDEIWLFVAKDESAAAGGIASLSPGDAAWRTADLAADADAPAWSFQGRIRNETPSDWELLFARRRMTRYGPPE